MAASIQDHCHLDDVTPPVNTYAVVHGSWDSAAEVPVATERSVTGKLHVHRIVDGSGDPYQFVSDRAILRLSLANMLAVKALAGKTVYYVSPYHDSTHPAAETITGVLIIPRGGVVNVDPMCTYWNVTIQIVDDDTVT